MAEQDAKVELGVAVLGSVAGRAVEFAIAGERVALSDAAVDRLLGALGQLELRGAATLADDIAALRLAGRRIDLCPTEAELDALQVAAAGLGANAVRPSRSLLRLSALCGSGVLAEAEIA